MAIDKKIQKKSSLAKIINAKDLDINFDNVKSSSSVGFSTWVRALSQNWRQGTVSCKGRSDVEKTNKKPWKQKGTGRARAGSARSPLWRGGGVTFGPQPRVKSLKVSKGLKKKVLRDLLYNFINNKKLISLDWVLDEKKPKTSVAFSALKNAQLTNEKIVLFVKSDDLITRASYANIPNVNILYFDQANAFDLANSSYWLYLDKDKEFFKGMVARWI